MTGLLKTGIPWCFLMVVDDAEMALATEERREYDPLWAFGGLYNADGTRRVPIAEAPVGQGGGSGVAEAGRGGGRGGAAPAGRGGGRGGRGGGRGRQPNRRNYTINEMTQMIESVERHLPISGAQWDAVAAEHHAYYPDYNRTGDQLRTKFNALARLDIPTGDPTMPPHVRAAKRARYKIIERSEGAQGDEEFPLALQESDTEDNTSGGILTNINVAGANSGNGEAEEDATVACFVL